METLPLDPAMDELSQEELLRAKTVEWGVDVGESAHVPPTSKDRLVLETIPCALQEAKERSDVNDAFVPSPSKDWFVVRRC